jgi:hypothetical protein
MPAPANAPGCSLLDVYRAVDVVERFVSTGNRLDQRAVASPLGVGHDEYFPKQLHVEWLRIARCGICGDDAAGASTTRPSFTDPWAC